MTTMLRVKATRNFGVHTAGDELLVGDTAEHRANIDAGLYELLERKTTAPPVTTGEKPPPKAKPAAKKSAAKPKKKA